MTTTAVNGQSTQRHHVQGQHHAKKKVEGQQNQPPTLLSYSEKPQPAVKPFQSDYDNPQNQPYGRSLSYFG